MGALRARRVGQHIYSVREDWSAWLPNEMDQLFDATRNELECANAILSVTLDEALAQCEQSECALGTEQATVFADLFDRLASRLRMVIYTIENHGSQIGTLPNVTPLASANFRGSTSQRISRMSSLLAKVVFRSRTRFFHKLQSLREIIEELQEQVREIVEEGSSSGVLFPGRAWQELEVRGYDLHTCTSETTVILKSFFCVLPGEELDSFRQKLSASAPGMLIARPGLTEPFQRK
jgi:hypothetical protein